MKRIIFIFSLILFITTSLFGAGIREERNSIKEKPFAENFDESAIPAGAGSSVWKVTKNGNTLFLGGSIHMLREKDFPLPEEFDYAFLNSDVLVLEADIERMNDPEIMQYMISQMLLPEGVSIHSLLDPEIYDHLTEVCAYYSIPIFSVAQIKPSMVVTMLSMLQIEELGFQEKGIDDYFLEIAKQEKKLVIFLESVQAQIDMLTSLGEGYENEYVSYSLMDMEHTEDVLEMTVFEWRYGLTGTNEESLLEMRDEWPQMYKTLITNRHDAWMPQIEKFIASGKVHFVIAGLFHMHGPDGLRQRLEKSGYSIEHVVIK